MKPQKYTFDAEKLKRCITHALTARTWCDWDYGAEPVDDNVIDEPSLLLMNDEIGAYLMSAGYPRDRLRNKKVYSVYANECHIRTLTKFTSATITDVECKAINRLSVLLRLPLSVGENGHCYEEYLAEGFETCVITMPTEAVVEFQTKRKHGDRYFTEFDENQDGTLDGPILRGKRRMQSLEQEKADAE